MTVLQVTVSLVYISILSITVVAVFDLLVQFIANAESRRLYSESNQLLIDAFSDFDFSAFSTKYYFTQRYLDFLQDLLYGNSTMSNMTMYNNITDDEAVNMTYLSNSTATNATDIS